MFMPPPQQRQQRQPLPEKRLVYSLIESERANNDSVNYAISRRQGMATADWPVYSI